MRTVGERSQASMEVASSLNERCYEQYEDQVDTRLAKATREYMSALCEAALDFEEIHAHLRAPDFMLMYHDNLSCDLHVV